MHGQMIVPCIWTSIRNVNFQSILVRNKCELSVNKKSICIILLIDRRYGRFQNVHSHNARSTRLVVQRLAYIPIPPHVHTDVRRTPYLAPMQQRQAIPSIRFLFLVIYLAIDPSTPSAPPAPPQQCQGNQGDAPRQTPPCAHKTPAL
jgi:hypothetical protein